MGVDKPPKIPTQVLDSALKSIWSDPSLRDDDGLMAGPDYPGFTCHHDIRVPFQHREYQFDPHHTEIKSSSATGYIDFALYAKPRGTSNETSHIILLVEVKAGDETSATAGVTSAMAKEVDVQIRTRANGAQASGVNEHFYLIGLVGYCFRPYYWCQGEGRVPIDIDPSRSPGFMRPSDSDLILSRSHVVPGPHPSLWRDIREPDNQRLLQQVIRDAIRACDGFGPEYPAMHGKPCETVSMMTREGGFSTDESPQSAMSSA